MSTCSLKPQFSPATEELKSQFILCVMSHLQMDSLEEQTWWTFAFPSTVSKPGFKKSGDGVWNLN